MRGRRGDERTRSRISRWGQLASFFWVSSDFVAPIVVQSKCKSVFVSAVPGPGVNVPSSACGSLSAWIQIKTSTEFKFTVGDFLKNRGLSADFHSLLFTKENTANLKCLVDKIHGMVWFGTDFGV